MMTSVVCNPLSPSIESLSLFSTAIIPNCGIFVKLNRQYFVSFSVYDLISKELVCGLGRYKLAVYVRFRFPHPIMVVLLRGFHFHIRFIHHLSLLLYSYYLIFSYHCQVFSALNVKKFPPSVEQLAPLCGNPWPAGVPLPRVSVSCGGSASYSTACPWVVVVSLPSPPSS